MHQSCVNVCHAWDIKIHIVQTKELKCAYARCCNTGKTRWHSLEHDLECCQVQAKVCVRCINRVSMFVTREMTSHIVQTKELKCASARCWNTGKTRWHNLEHDLECRRQQAMCVRWINRVSMFVTREMTSHISQTKELRCAIFVTRETTRHTLHTKKLRFASARCWNTGKTRWHNLEHDLECRQVQAKVCIRCINRVSMFVTREMTSHKLQNKKLRCAMFVTREMTRYTPHTKKLRCALVRCCNTGKTRWHILEHDLECRQVQAKMCVRCINRVSMFVTREMISHKTHTTNKGTQVCLR
jgi:hypothetical protein